jgi:glycosyltransferase involved in cell wall biosynthesis
VVYDLRVLTPAMHGIARYALGLLRGIVAAREELSAGLPGGLAITALIPRAEDAGLLPQDPRLEVAVCDLPPYGLKAQLKLPGVLKRLGTDLYHCPTYAPPVAWRGPMLMSVHDLIHLRFPKDHSFKHRLFYDLVVGPAARKSRAVFTVSQHSRKDLIELLGVPPRRVEVTSCGVDPAFSPPGPEALAQAAYQGLPPRYILGVGNPRPHKNLPALVEAHRLLRRELAASREEVPPLVLVGVKEGELPGLEPDRGLLLRPSLDDADLALAYGAAEMVVVPSLYEGFGLPALEALACAAPVVAARRASLPEVVGEAGLLCEPDSASLARAMARVLTEPGLAEQMRMAGPRQAAGFTWDKAAASVLAVYARAPRGLR